MKTGLSMVLAFGLLTGLAGCPTTDTGVVTYEVTIQNLSNQPLGPVVSATHPTSTVVWRVGQNSSAGVQRIAEFGDPSVLAGELTALVGTTITTVNNTGRPLTRMGTTQPAFGPFAPGDDLIDNANFQITGLPGDVFSCASMVIISNDGFWGIDSVGLPASGSKTIYCFAYDTGTEENSELAADLDDGGSILGEVLMVGDDITDMVNENGGTATDPRGVIELHGGIQGVGSIDPMISGWSEPIAVVTISVVE